MNNPKTVFIVSSVIYFKEGGLSYAKTRSMFTPEERALQTVKTIESIRQKMPEAKIVLVESGKKADLPHGLSSLADSYVYLGGNFLVRKACDSIFKGFGEAITLISASKILRAEKADVYFKLSGRYFLNENFTLRNWPKDGLCGKVYKKTFSTRLYSFSGNSFSSWRRALFLSLPLLLLNRALEETLPKFFLGKINNVEVLGVSGPIAVNGEFLEE